MLVKLISKLVGLFVILLAVGACQCAGISCEMARIKCAYRMGCGTALHSYMMNCADLIGGRTKQCDKLCQRALIALMTSEEGQHLIECDCDGSKFCQLNKEKIEVCRPDVIEATAEGSVVSCSTATWICSADPLCSTALDFYHRHCGGLFRGKRCTPRCNNSLSILNRQDKASKLKSCYCDGSEDFPCRMYKDNTEALCYRNSNFDVNAFDLDDNGLDQLRSYESSPANSFHATLNSLWSATLVAVAILARL